MKKLIYLLIIALIIFWFIPSVNASPPTNFQTTPVITSGLSAPSGFEFAPDGRIFILQRTGEVLIYKNGQLLTQPFTVLPSSNTGDRGLIGITFDPNFLTNHWVYFYYNSSTDLLNYLVRFDASGDVGTNGPTIIYHTDIQSQMLHQGGGLTFGTDGKIYLGIGDNGTHTNAQDLTNPFGKIIRINKDGSIPTDNPFYNQVGAAREIWAYGFRNPWRMQFDSASGRLYVSDVGEASWEEVDLVLKGGNYGWPLSEGMCTSNCTGQINPIYTYPHNSNGAGAITGGPVYHGSMFPSPYPGSYFFGDYAQGFIKYLTLDANGNSTGVNTFDTNTGSVVDLKVAPDGSLYYLDIYPAALFQVIYSTGNKIPVVNATSDISQGLDPLLVNFSSSGTSDPDGDTLTYLWDFGDGTTSTTSSPQHIFQNKGRYTVILRVSDGIYSVPSNPIVIQVGKPPVITVNSPVNAATYNAGDTISYSATAVDGTGVTMPSSDFTTQVVFHHNTHIHPFLGPLTGIQQGTFTIPTLGESSADTYYEIDFTATDTYGLSTTMAVNIYPHKVNLNLVTSPSALQIMLDGAPTNTPQTIQQVVGFQREFRPVAQQLLNGVYYQLDHWWDNGPAAHYITIPSTDLTATAYYAQMPAFTGQYFSNANLSGTPTLIRQDPIINFSWGNSAPDPTLPQTNFSVRWEKTQNFVAGRYIFTTLTDDGVRLFIDGVNVIDQWQDQGNTLLSKVLDLTTGNHTIKMEYYQAAGGATAKLSWDLTPDQPLSNPSTTPTPTVNPVPTATLTPTPTTGIIPTPTPTPTITIGTELLTNPWHLSTTTGGSAEAYQSIPPNSLLGMSIVTLTYNLHGLCVLPGDASAIIFDQPLNGAWHYISLANFGTNCLDGNQTVNIPLSQFPGLDLTQPVGTFHTRFWSGGSYTIDITSAKVSSSGSSPTPTPTPTPTVTTLPTSTPTPTPVPGTQLLTTPMHLSTNGGSVESYQSIPPNVLSGFDTLQLTYDIHGSCILGGDASAIIFDQPANGAWHFISLSNYGTNCKDGTQIVNIPLSQFSGLNTSQPVGNFHVRFWFPTALAVDITSALLVNSGTTNPTPTPTPTSIIVPTPTPTTAPASGTQLLSTPWHLAATNGSSEAYQSVTPNVLNGKTTLTLTYNLYGFCALGGDASAIIFDQPAGGAWHYISLSNYGQNCYMGNQTVTIPLSQFPALNINQPVGTFHSRFWAPTSFAIDINSAVVN